MKPKPRPGLIALTDHHLGAIVGGAQQPAPSPGWLSKIRSRCAPLGAVVALLGCFAAPSAATTLLFDQIRDSGVVIPTISGNAIEQDYGDRVSGSPMNVPGGQFTYGNDGEGFTPNVVVAYSTATSPLGISLWADSYGDLTNVLFGNQNSMSLLVDLTADPGFDVLLYHFDLGGWPNTDYTIGAVRVLNGATELFSETDVLVEGDLSSPRHTSFDFLSPLAAPQLRIEIDYSNLAGSLQDNIGIDNIRFGQDPPAPTLSEVPESSTAVLLGLGLLALALRRRTSSRRTSRNY